MEVAVELEDDLFFADISKQISLLIMEDEEEPVFATCPSVSFQVFTLPHVQTSSNKFMGLIILTFCVAVYKKNGQFQTFSGPHFPARPSPYVHLQEQIYRREIRSSKGTGVFIPRSSQPTGRKHHYKPGGRNASSFGAKSNAGQHPNTTKTVSQARKG
ncbi:hypothetical protein DM860_017335 [Cuscuta australis]|uniref:Uncharacterized protein n=1 Tax=Cuscuta australis TaxID=267555 RepID=A0A328DCL5_9ASTE|nr:hypothetical protein DM860_017335 [Cuscuta australis]